MLLLHLCLFARVHGHFACRVALLTSPAGEGTVRLPPESKIRRANARYAVCWLDRKGIWIHGDLPPLTASSFIVALTERLEIVAGMLHCTDATFSPDVHRYSILSSDVRRRLGKGTTLWLCGVNLVRRHVVRP